MGAREMLATASFTAEKEPVRIIRPRRSHEVRVSCEQVAAANNGREREKWKLQVHVTLATEGGRQDPRGDKQLSRRSGRTGRPVPLSSLGGPSKADLIMYTIIKAASRFVLPPLHRRH